MRKNSITLALRDGWQDARLFHHVGRQLNALTADHIVGRNDDSLIRLAEETHEVYRWTTIDNLQSPVALNNMRRALLQAAIQHSPEE
jgi:hypothetical protein